MTVKQLIAELKKMPQAAKVGFRDHDASAHSVSSWVCSVSILDKATEPFPDYINDKWDKEIYESFVVLGA